MLCFTAWLCVTIVVGGWIFVAMINAAASADPEGEPNPQDELPAHKRGIDFFRGGSADS